MLEGLDEKVVILIGFVGFLGVVYVFLYRFVDNYLSNQVTKVVSDIESQKKSLALLQKESDSLNKEFVDLKKECLKEITNVKKENDLLIAQHKNITVFSDDDDKSIKKYLDSRLKSELVKLQKSIVSDGVRDVLVGFKQVGHPAMDVEKITKKLEKLT